MCCGIRINLIFQRNFLAQQECQNRSESIFRCLEDRFTEDSMVVSLDDGRSVSVPLAWYPRLSTGTAMEREQYELIGDGEGIHWPELNEDISVEGIIAGRRSSESAESLTRWLTARQSSSM